VRQLVEYKDAVAADLNKEDLTYVDVASHGYGEWLCKAPTPPFPTLSPSAPRVVAPLFVGRGGGGAARAEVNGWLSVRRSLPLRRQERRPTGVLHDARELPRRVRGLFGTTRRARRPAPPLHPLQRRGGAAPAAPRRLWHDRTGGRLGSAARPSLGARQGGCVAGIRGPFGTTLTHARCPAAGRRSSARRWPTCRTRGPSSRTSPRRSGRSRPRPALFARARRGALCAALLRTARCRARDHRPAPRGPPPLAARAKDSSADTRGVLRQVAASLVTLPLTALSANPQFLSIAAALGAPPPCPAPAPGIHSGRTPSCPGQCETPTVRTPPVMKEASRSQPREEHHAG